MVKITFLFLCTILFTQCSTPIKWHLSNPVYDTTHPRITELMGISFVAGETYILSSIELSDWTQIDEFELLQKFPSFLNQSLETEFRSIYQAPLLSVALDTAKHPIEKIAIDSNVFISTRLPLQGERLYDDKKKSPRFLFIVQQVFLGPNINKNLFDINLQDKLFESQAPEKKSIALVLSYSLWDNSKQQYLKHGAIEVIEYPKKNLDIKTIESMIHKMASSLVACIPWRN